MLKQQNNFDNLLNNTILTIDTIKKLAIKGFDDVNYNDYFKAHKSLDEIVRLCNKFFIVIDYIKQCYSLDKSPDLNNLQ